MDGALLFFLLCRYPNQGQRLAVTLDEAVQFQAQRLGIQSIGLYPLVTLIQLLRANHLTPDPQRTQLPLQTKAKPARFLNRVHLCSLVLQLGHPSGERLPF